MKFLQNKLLIVITIICLILLFVRCGDNNEQGEIKEITIGTFSKSMGNVPFYIAKENGWFEQALGDEFKIKYFEYNDRPSIASAISRGELKFVFSAEAPAMLIEAQGEDIEFENISATLTQEIIVRTASDLMEIRDLKDKTVAVLAGTSSHYALLKILSDNGLAISDVKIQFMPPAEAKTAFETGMIDAWAVWPPWVEQQEVTNFARALIGSNAVIHSVGSMPEEFVDLNFAIADSLSEVIERAKDWIINNPEKSKEITAKQLGLDIEVVNLAWTKFNWSSRFNDSILDDMQKKADFLAKENLTRNSMIINVEDELIGDFLKD